MPFPFVEQPRLRYRPALVVSAPALAADTQLCWVLMITSFENRGWPGDVSLEHCYAECGLPAPSVIRTAKISTVEVSNAREIGRLRSDLMAEVTALLTRHLPR